MASFLDARAHGGRWLLRIEDLDRPREVAGSADGILRTLRGVRLRMGRRVVRQRDRIERYAAALRSLAGAQSDLRVFLQPRCSWRTKRAIPGTCRDASG